MRRRLLGSSLGILLVAGLLSQSALAQGSNNTGLSPDEQRLAELHAAIAAQQERIGMLEQQVVATGAGGAQVGQTELIREQIRALLSEQEFRESLAPAMLQAGYDGGFFIRSSDDLFLMKVKTCMQFRWTHYGTSSRNKYRSPRLERADRTGFAIQRLRPSFRGHVYSPDLTYEIQLDMSSDGGYDASAYYGYVNYRFAEEFQVMLGLFKLAGTRGQMISSGSFQFVDNHDLVAQTSGCAGTWMWSIRCAGRTTGPLRRMRRASWTITRPSSRTCCGTCWVTSRAARGGRRATCRCTRCPRWSWACTMPLTMTPATGARCGFPSGATA
jgi:hypothetical protein